ncbi:MAG: metal ABC transporter ATP-binding protein [Thermoplasmata archaeon]|nr:metal ABC transporter ATP-binding protein [Thermoplasmata archaeon]MCI4359499.1 metal ABC transporter ATP-binding protein [Thermoplasmata archaeon]
MRREGLDDPPGGGSGDVGSVIRADGLEVGYRDHVVWKDASFTVERGEFIALIGPNGAGKTTLFRLLLGLQRPRAGTLTVFGVRPERGNPRIGYVPQRHTIDNETNVESETLVRLGGSGARWGPGFSWRAEREAAAVALRAVGATELAHRPLGALSGGELQRIFLAEALIGNPEMLLLDEPLSNLDLRRSRELVELVHGLVQSRHVTTLLVAHDINPLIECLDKVIYVANGHVATGRPDEVLTSEGLSALYGVSVEVLHDSRNNIVIVGGENPHEGRGP